MYEKTDVILARKRATRETAIAGALLAVGLTLAVVALVVRNHLLGAIGLALFAILAYARWALFAWPLHRYLSFLKQLDQGLKRQTQASFISIESTPRLTEEGVRVRGVSVTESPNDASAEPVLFYWDDHYPFPPITPGQQLALITHDRYIIKLSPIT